MSTSVMEKCCVYLGTKEPDSKSVTKLCLICLSRRRSNFRERCYDVFILDQSENSDAFVPRVPDLTFEGLGTVSFCALNSSIYMFESSGYNEAERKSVYTCDLSAFLSEENSCLNSTLKYNSNSLLEQAPSMHGVKPKCAAVVTPRGQILVFNQCIVLLSSPPKRVDFELYDPVTESWRVLPQLRTGSLVNVAKHILRIRAYGFLSESLFCVVTTTHGSFALDLDHDQESLQWNRLDARSFGRNDLSQFFLVDDELYLTLEGVKRRDNGCLLFNFLRYRTPTPGLERHFHSMSPISISPNQELRFCNVQSTNNEETRTYTTVNVCTCDLAKCRREKGLSVTVKTLKFFPKTEEIMDSYHPWAIFPFGTDSLSAFTSNSSP